LIDNLNINLGRIKSELNKKTLPIITSTISITRK